MWDCLSPVVSIDSVLRIDWIMSQASAELAGCFLSCLLSCALDKESINMQNVLAEMRMQLFESYQKWTARQPCLEIR